MPGGLRDVEQRFTADASGYLAAIRQMVEGNQGLTASVRDTLSQVRQAQEALGKTGVGGGASADIAKMNAEIRAGLSLARDFGAAHAAAASQVAAASAAIRDTTGSVGDLAAGFERARASVAAMAADAMAQSERIVAGFERGSAQVRVFSTDVAGLRSSASATAAAVDDVSRSIDVLRAKASGAGAATTSVLGPALAAAMASGGGPGGGTTDAATAAIIARNLASRGYGPTSGGTSAVDTALASLLGGAGGGILGGGGGAGGGGGGGGGFTAGTAAATFANVARWVRNVYPYVHWAMMATNEVLATAGPAAVALGGAALVGWQGGQQLVNRYQAVSSVAEALGPTTGQSTATMLGIPNTLQQLQNQYGSGEMYGIAGAGLNALRTGGGNAFLQLGQNTLSMISGAAADFVLAMKGGLGQAAGAIVQGGTGYAQQFGDVLGNVGKIFMNVAPNLPGVGSMLLTTLQAGTGGIADATKALGPGLLPLLGFEAGSRWGPTIVGGAAAGLEKLPFGIGGKVAAGGEAGTGLAGILGGLTAPEIGGLAVAAIAITKGLTGKTAAQQQYAGLASSLTGANLVGNLSQIATGAMAGGGLPPAQLGSLWPQLGFSPGGGFTTGKAGTIFGGGLAQVGQGFGDQMKQGALGIGDLFTGQWSKALHSVGSMWQDLVSPGGIIHGLGQMLGIVGPPPSPAQAAMQQMGQAFGTWSNMLGAPAQVKGIWKEMGSGALTTAQSLDVLAQSGVNINTAFQKNGELTAKASQQVKDYVAGYQAMTGTVPGGATGGTLAAINAVGIAGGLQASKLATTNAALDQIVQIASGGGAGTAALTTLLAAIPGATTTAAGKVIPPALGQGPLTAAGAAAFTAFSSTTQPSVISQLQQNMDWLRTSQVLGAFGASGGAQTGMAKFLIGQAFNAPGVAGSPLAMAQLSPIAQQYGMAPLTPGESAKQYDAAFKSFLKGADSAKRYGEALTQTTEKVSSLPADYQQFVTTASGGAQAGLANAVNMFGQQVQQQFMGAFAGGKAPTAQQTKEYANVLAAAGFKPGAAGDVAGYAAKVGGATPGQVQSVIHGIIKYTAQFETPKPRAAHGVVTYANNIPAPKPKDGYGVIHYANSVPPVPHPVGYGTIIYSASIVGLGSARTVSAAGSVGSLGGHTGQKGMLVPGFGGGDIFPAMLEPGELVVPKHLVSSVSPILSGRIPGFASGGIAGVTVPDVTGLGMPMRIAMQSGFNQMTSGLNTYLGGLMQPYGGGGGSYRQGLPISQAVPVRVVSGAGAGIEPGGHVPLPPAVSKVIDAFEGTFQKMKAPWGKLSSEILNELLGGIRNGKKETAAMAKALVSQVSSEISSLKGMGSPWAGIAAQIMSGMLDGIKGNKGETAKMAQAMFDQVTKEVNYMKTVAGATNAISQWGNFGGGLATPTTTAQGQNYQYYTDQQAIAGGGTVSVQQNMGDYLQAMKSFQGDIGKLSKGGINRQMLQQIIGAGPLQGDQEAQSILGGTGGVKGANQLWNQINAMSKSLGITAGQDVYGFGGGGGAGGKNVKVGATANAAPVHALQSAINALHGKTVVIKVQIDGGSGSGGAASGSPQAMTKFLTQEIQASLLKQAKRNRRTGIALPGYGS